jgi:acyl transferase domain-containing protein
MHGQIYYEGAAQPQNMQHAHPFYNVHGAQGMRVDHSANLLANFNRDHENRRRRRRNGQGPPPNPPPPPPVLPEPAYTHNAPLPQPPPAEHDYDHFNAQFHQHIQNLQNEDEQTENQRSHQVREEMLQRQAQEAHRQQQLQQQLLQRRAEEAQQQQQLQQQLLLQRQAEEAQRQQQLQQQLLQRQAQEAYLLQQHQQQLLQRQAQLEEAEHQQQLQEQSLQRQAQEAQQLQQQLLQREREEAQQLLQRQAQETQQQQQLQQQLLQREAAEAHHQQQQHDEELRLRTEEDQRDRRNVAQQAAQRAVARAERRRQQDEHLEEAQEEARITQEHHEQDQERRRTQQEEHRQLVEAEDEHRAQAPILPIPLGGRPYAEPVALNSLGPLNIVCSHCHALHFMSEKLSNSSLINPRFGTCCLQGQVSIPPFKEWPADLKAVYAMPGFLKHGRQYNSAVSFTSLGVKLDERALNNSGPRAFSIHGELHHLQGSLLPQEGNQPVYAQLFIYDSQEATDIRANRNPNLDPNILRELHDILFRYHPWAQICKHAYQIMSEKPPEEHANVHARIHFQEGTDG